MEEGAWLVSASTSATTMRVVHDSDEEGATTIQHDLRFYAGELRLGVGYGLAERFGMELEVPVRYTRSEITYRALDGTVITPERPDVHHRDETLRGVGDPRIGGRTGWRAGHLTISALLGITAPFGKTEPNPFELGDRDEPHQHIQFGTGTTNPFVDLDVSLPIGRFGARAYVTGRTALYENEHGYRAGSRFQAGSSVQFPAWNGVGAGVGFDFAHEEPERWNGKVQQDGNLGRTDGLVGLSVGRSFGPVDANASISTPVFQRVRGGQLDYPAIVGFSLSRTIGSVPK